MRENAQKAYRNKAGNTPAGPVLQPYLVFEILPEISLYIQYCILNLGTEDKVNTWGTLVQRPSYQHGECIATVVKERFPRG